MLKIRILMLIAAMEVAFSSPFAQAQYAPSACARGYYQNADAICVHKPTAVPHEGATALCRDGLFPTQHAGRIFAPTTAALPSF
jgi:hypothetical protein